MASMELEEKKQREQDIADGINWECTACGQLWQEDQLVEIRECPHCQEFFNGTDEGRNCPECNRLFTSKVTDQGCPDCVDDSEVKFVGE